MTKTNNDTHAALLAAAAAARAAALDLDAARAAKAEAEGKREAFRSTPEAVQYRLVAAEIAAIETREALALAIADHKRAGGGHPAEVIPESWALATLTDRATRIAGAILDAEEQIAALRAEGAAMVGEATAERDAVAASRVAGDPLGAPPPVNARVVDVVLEAERQRRAGRTDDVRIAIAAGWTGSMGGGDTAGLHGEELIAAALSGVRPKPKSNGGRLASLKNQAREMEAAAARAVERAAEEKARREAERADHEAEKAEKVRRDAAMAQAWRDKIAEEQERSDAARAAGRAALLAGEVPAGPTSPSSKPAWRTL